MKILIVEDDSLFAGWITEELRRAFAKTRGGVELILISTESQFRARFGDFAASPPDVIVMDVMLRWADANPDLEPPPHDVIEEGFYLAGFRCERLLASDPRTSSIPVVFFTVLDASAMEHGLANRRNNVRYVPKTSNVDALARTIREITTAQ